MQTRSFRGSGEPARVNASSNARFGLGADPRRALGPAAIRAASTGRTHDRTRPMLHQRKKALVNQAPSTHDPERTLAILSRSRRFIFRCFRDHAYFVSIGAGPRRSWSAAEKATSIAESYGAGETGLWCRAASRSNVAAAVRLAAAGQADRSVCAGHIHPGGGAGGTGGCVTAERRPLAIRYSASTSIGPPVSPKSRRTSSRTARRRSSDKAANAWPVEAPPRSNGP